KTRLRADDLARHAHLLVIIRIHEVALLFIGVKKVHGLFLYRQILDLDVSAEAVLPQGTSAEILEAGIGRAAHLALARMIFRRNHFIDLSLVPHGHSGAQLGSDYHGSAGSRQTAAGSSLAGMPFKRVYYKPARLVVAVMKFGGRAVLSHYAASPGVSMNVR